MTPMDTEPIPILQLPLFDYGESVSNVVELFPAVWQATECLTSPDSSVRERGLEALFELGAQKVSPLVAYMVATCLNDQEIAIRRQVTYILADLLIKDASGKPIHEEVRKVVVNYLHKLNETTIYGLLEITLIDPEVEKSVFHLLNACPYAGRHLGDILNNWKNPIQIRQKAVYFIGWVGYLEELPVLERLYSRLEARQNGQTMMSFVPPSSKSDEDILPALRVAIRQLQTR